MSFLDRILGNNQRREDLQDRLRGENSQANHGLSQSMSRNASTAATTAARAADGAMSPAAAQRLASQQQQAANAQATQVHAQQRSAEVQRAENELQQMRQAKSGFARQLFGGAMQAGGNIASTLGIGGQASPTDAPLAGAAGAAGTAMGGPLAGAAASKFAGMMFGGGGDPIKQMDVALGIQNAPGVSDDRLLAAAPTPSAPVAPAPAASSDPMAQLRQQLFNGSQGLPAGMTPEQYAEWLRTNGGR